MTKTHTHIAYLIGVGLAIYSQQAALALFLGIGLALTVGPAPLSDASRLSRGALQSGVVILGLALPFREVVTLGSANGAVVSAMVLATLVGGLILLKLIRTDDVSGKLLTTGTAVCGGTAVATLAPVIKAENQQVAQTLTIIFVLNGIAIVLFPAIGHALDLSQQQFGMWAAVAIHDTSSVVGAAAAYGDEALTTAATLKILRILWLIPVIIVASYSMKRISANEIRIPLLRHWLHHSQSDRRLLPVRWGRHQCVFTDQQEPIWPRSIPHRLTDVSGVAQDDLPSVDWHGTGALVGSEPRQPLLGNNGLKHQPL